MTFQHATLPSFWDCYEELPAEIRERADKQFELLQANPRHPSLQLKPVGEFWPARVNDDYRALALREKQTFTWFWIGSHADYDKIV